MLIIIIRYTNKFRTQNSTHSVRKIMQKEMVREKVGYAEGRGCKKTNKQKKKLSDTTEILNTYTQKNSFSTLYFIFFRVTQIYFCIE